MKIQINARLKVEGIHRWEDCPIEEVSYLRDYHRHQFHITVNLTVSHLNRSVEFIQLTHNVRYYLNEKYFKEEYQCLYFGNGSCEMIAEELLRVFNADSVEVNEDGESGSTVFAEKKDIIQTEPKVIVVCGRNNSGKDTYCKKFIEFEHISIGDIVRELTKKNERTHDAGLQQDIIEELAFKMQDKTKKYIINGIRQMSIINAILKITNRECLLVWLEVSEKELEKRYNERKADKDKNLTFAEIIERDNKLGLEQVEQFIKVNYHRSESTKQANCQIIQN